MSDSPEHPNPPVSDPQDPQDPQESQDPQAPAAAEPAPTSVAPEGLEPSPGIAAPAGMTAPDISGPEFAAPEQPAQRFEQAQYGQQDYGQPQFEQPQFEQPQFEQPQFEQPQFEQQNYGQPQFDQQPAASQYGQQPDAPQYGQPQYGQDPAQQQYAQNPAQQQYAQAPAGPGGPAGPGTPAGPGGPDGPNGPKKGLSTGAIIGIIAGAVAVVVLLVIGGIFAVGSMLSPSSSGDATGDTGSSEGKSVKSAKTADGTVEQFLNALAEGDANTARKLAGGATSDELLSDKALAASLAVAPITNIVVDPETDEPSDYEAIVSATFDIGDETVNRDFKLWKSSNSWELFDGLVSFSLDTFDGLEPQINGLEMHAGSSVKAFPGAYQLTLGLDRFELDSKTDTFMIGTRNDAEVFYELKPRLTETATEEYRTLVTEALNTCLESKTFTTECGLEVSEELNGGEKVIDGTIVRKLDAEGDAKLKRLKPESSYSAPTVVSTYDYITVTMTAEVDKDGTRSSGTLYGAGSLLSPTVDFAAEDPQVTWE